MKAIVVAFGKVTLEGFDGTHRRGIPFDNVVFDDPQRIQVWATHADVKSGPGACDWKVTGRDVTVAGSAGKSVQNACTDKFVPFPQK